MSCVKKNMVEPAAGQGKGLDDVRSFLSHFHSIFFSLKFLHFCLHFYILFLMSFY